MPAKLISLAECKTLLQAGTSLNILDVRTPAEYGRVHAVGARLVPLDQLDAPALAAAHRAGDGPIYVICHSGARAAKACERLASAGLTDVYCVEGGTAAWQKSGLPVEQGKGTVISLERQVRIAAGALVLLGVLLAWRLNPAFIAISAFVGAGLLFAGLTDFCGVAIVLGKMPWNRGG